MDNKENVCSVSENSNDLAFRSQSAIQIKKARREDRSNLRKSLAWNQAFFTEEGVLDSTELSTLCRSANKSIARHGKGSSIPKINDALSPLRSSDASKRSNSHGALGIESNYKKDTNLHSDLNLPNCMSPQINTVQEKTPVIKSTIRRIPVAPSSQSLKRTVDAATIAPSKIPKFSAPMSRASTVSSNVKCGTPTRLPNRSLIPGKAVTECSKYRKSSLAQSNNLICPTSFIQTSEEDTRRQNICEDLDLRKHTTSSLSKPQIPVSSKSTLPTCGSSGIDKAESTLRKNPGSIQFKASGLKMPTPSLGFFCKEKVHSLAQKGSQSLFGNIQLSSVTKVQTPLKALSLSRSSRDLLELSRGKGNQDALPVNQNPSGLKVFRNEEKVERKSAQLCPSVGYESSNICNLPPQEFNETGMSGAASDEVDTCTINVPNVSGPICDGKIDLLSNSSAENHHKLVRRCSSFRKERDDKSLLVLSSSSYKSFQLSESEASESNAMIKDQEDNTNLLRVPSAQSVKTEHQETEKLSQNIETQAASWCPSKPLLKKELVMKPQDTSTLLNQLKAAPFSDEWIAALETYGEDILLVKSGAVQNSPKEKLNVEPGPWSPVKRKNQDVGPYDCTKYTKNLSATDKSP